MGNGMFFKLNSLGVVVVLLVLAGLLSPACTPEPSEKEKVTAVALGSETMAKEVTAVVQRFLDMLATRDVSKKDEILMPMGISVSSRGQQGKEAVLRIRTFKELTATLPGGKVQYKEVMTEPRTMIHKGIAVVITGYKFYVDGTFSHDGVDIFSLVRTKQGWKIAGIVYTVNK